LTVFWSKLTTSTKTAKDAPQQGCSATLIAGFAHRFRPATFRRNMVNIDQTDVCSEFMLVSFIIHPLLLDGQKRGFCVGLL
jgi:hypothetical protein